MIQSKTSNEISFTVFNLNSISEQGKSIKGSQLILRQKKFMLVSVAISPPLYTYLVHHLERTIYFS